MTCTRCESSGFINLHQVSDEVLVSAEASDDFHAFLKQWMTLNKDNDVRVCDCCGNGEDWYGMPGEHDPSEYGKDGPYRYNGGLPECW